MAKRKPLSEETKRKIGKANSKPKIKKNCGVCGSPFFVIPALSHQKYCSIKCMGISQIGKSPNSGSFKKGSVPWNTGKKFDAIRGEKHFNWKGGKILSVWGYFLIKTTDHPFADSDGYVREHRLVMESSIGRYLNPKEVVHHIDGNPKNNNIENLMLFANQKEHIKYHNIARNKQTGCFERG
jgi:hypothetical protein